MTLLNCDLGEWESEDQCTFFMSKIDMANVACGGHAGSAYTLEYCRKTADENGVKIGMHPGVQAEKGRGDVSHLSVNEFVDLIEQQYAFFIKYGGFPHHFKLHGSLYHLSEKHTEIANATVEFCKKNELIIVCLAGGGVAQKAQKAGLNVLNEAFLDRNYNQKGELLPRSHEYALVSDLSIAKQRLEDIRKGKGILSIKRATIPLEIDTVCVHSDSELCIDFLKTL